jgi:hypothetical protein
MTEKPKNNPVHRLPDWRTTLPLAQRSPRCGARTRSGNPCKSPAMANGRCRMHGGKSTGPRTVEGLERMRSAKMKHGLYSLESLQLMRAIRALQRSVGLSSSGDSRREHGPCKHRLTSPPDPVSITALKTSFSDFRRKSRRRS